MGKKNILLGVSGGIAVYKAVALVSKLTQAGFNVKVIMTESAMKFVTPLSFQVMSKNDVYTDTFDEKDSNVIAHIDLADWADLVIVAPATANVIGKLANRNKGYGREALSLMVDYAFTYLGLERLTIDILENNKPLKNITEKQEFKLEGIEKKAVYYRGKKINRLNYALLKEI